MKRIGILGGTFNPVHNGHLAVAQTAFEKLRLTKVIFVPAKLPVHKAPENVVAPAKRLKMVELAIQPYDHFVASDIEISRKGKSYSIETVQEFRKQYAKDKLYFIIGTDSSLKLHTWKRIDELVKMVSFVCINRPGNPPSATEQSCRHIKMPALDISSSMIRARIAKGLPVGFLLPKAVEEYIRKKKIYRSTQ
ncbi:MAG: nicotinate-nucleotide adenylyltransferase [Candidatus Omnitrophica bacterium]|nr:nicotinate-nucleotide adenylyltransferase [Candidatus Omnitrophota bacterium]